MAKRKTDPRWITTRADEQAIKDGCYFDERAGNLAVEFIEFFCRRSKGRNAGGKVKLLEWQRDLVMRLFGWMRADATRRFRTCYVEIPKKNGKSFLMSAIALYMLIADGESSAEVYLAAVNSKQARIIFDECVKMIGACPALAKRLNIKETNKKILYPATHSKVELVTCDADSQDGFDSSCTIFDELHRQKNTKLWDVFEYAGAGREQPLLLSITTAGTDRESVCWREHERSQKIIEGESVETSHLAIIYAAARDADLDDEATWYQANPSLGHTLRLDDFKAALDKVRESPSALNNFLRLRLNIWTQSETAFIKHEHWEKGNEPIDLAALEGQPCVCGIDLSSKKDITAFVMLFGDEDTGFTIVPHFWIPETEAAAREQQHSIPYKQWSKEGLITLVPGSAIDYDSVERTIVELSKRYKFKAVVSDDWGSAEAVCQRLKTHGIKVQYMRQGYRTLSEPTKELERQAILGKLKHGGNKVLTWMNGHAVVTSDPAGNVKLQKPNSDSPLKIDGLAALVEAVHEYLRIRRKPNIYSQRKPDFVGVKK